MSAHDRPEDLVGTEVCDLVLPSSRGTPFGLRDRIGHGPLVLFFYIKNGSFG